MKRLLALLAAVAMIAGAIVLRRAIDDGTVDAPGGGGDELVLACTTELRDVCERLTRADTVEILGPEAAIAAARAGEVDAWLTFDPWPAMAVVRTPSSFFDQRVIVAQSPLVLAARPDRVGASCGDAPAWACAVDAGAVALPRTDSALGPLVLGWALLDFSATERPGEPFAAQEFQLPAVQAFVDALDRSSNRPALDALQLFPAGPVAIGTTGADFDRVVAPSRSGSSFTAALGVAGATVAIVVTGPAAERVAGDPGLRQSLTDHGWSLGDAGSAGLPNAGVLFALQEEFS